uniref:Uncharacterized protein n=1 Tax=Panagrolaimus superbus TaxID=310955 RepID=A0A914YIF8_9BILA
MRRTLGPPGIILIFCIFKVWSQEFSDTEVTLAPPLPQCDLYQACSAEVSIYPILIPTTTISTATEEETTSEDPGYQAFSIDNEIMESSGLGLGSGEGSGDEYLIMSQMSVTSTPEVTVFPLYDEFVSTPTIFDFNAAANVSQKILCRCGENSDGEEQKCSFSNTTNTLTFDRTLKLAFCTPPHHKKRCIGRRNVIRIIADIHQSGEAIQNVLDTQIFCHCDAGFRRIGIEPWGDNGYAFLYQCKQ